MPNTDPARQTEPLWVERPKCAHSGAEKWSWVLALGLGVLAVSISLLIGYWRGF